MFSVKDNTLICRGFFLLVLFGGLRLRLRLGSGLLERLCGALPEFAGMSIVERCNGDAVLKRGDIGCKACVLAVTFTAILFAFQFKKALKKIDKEG